ncbi:hypothetical protein F2Q70_00002710 [Brassica cretica]|uniref:Uncharacterized protein n=1 Tax=Brassica cretica TaxID=69181 RepID=A0A8S9IPR8_BRACR|nr:hypothetical protein F2Q70_00002710 [Brassica cretica]
MSESRTKATRRRAEPSRGSARRRAQPSRRTARRRAEPTCGYTRPLAGELNHRVVTLARRAQPLCRSARRRAEPSCGCARRRVWPSRESARPASST